MSISIQKKILGTSRVNILYELEDNGSIIKQLIPYVIGVIGDIAGSQNIDEYYKRKFINIHKENFNDIFASIKPKCKIKFKIDQEKQQDLEFLSIKDFEPSSIIQKIPDLKNLEDKRLVLDDLLTRIMNNEEVNKILLNTFGKKNIDDFIKNINLFTVEEQKDLLINEIKNLIAKEKIEIKTSKDLQELLAGKIKNIQDTFNSCISEILHYPDFKNLESIWTGLFQLISKSQLNENFKIKILHATKQEIYDDFMNTISFDQSKFFKWIYDEEYGTYGGEAFSTLLFNFHIQKKDLTLLTKISEVCALSHCLSLFGIDAEFFNLKDFTQINQLNSVNRLFESKEYISFKKLRDNENSQYIALLFPRFIGRLPYHPDLNPAKNLPNFIEDMSDHENFLWINVVFAYAQRLAESFSQYQWFSTIAGPENGGNVDELPNYFYKDKGELVIKCPTETIITERQEKQFSDNGFICLCYCKNTDKATFFGSQTLHKPLVFYDNYATSNASLKCKIQSILNASLFAHAIKIMLMNKIGGFSSKSSLQKFINNWLTNYVLLNAESTSDETKALYPLQNAEVEVEENPALPGVYHSIVRITPHYQMDSATVSLRIVAKKGDK